VTHQTKRVGKSKNTESEFKNSGKGTRETNGTVKAIEQGNESLEISLNLIPDVTPVASTIAGVRETHEYRSEKQKEEDSFLFLQLRIQRLHNPSP